MSPQEFLSRAKRYAKENKLRFEFYRDRGKGSHDVLLLGDRRTVVKMSGSELPTGTLHAMLKQLGFKLQGPRN